MEAATTEEGGPSEGDGLQTAEAAESDPAACPTGTCDKQFWSCPGNAGFKVCAAASLSHCKSLSSTLPDLPILDNKLYRWRHHLLAECRCSGGLNAWILKGQYSFTGSLSSCYYTIHWGECNVVWRAQLRGPNYLHDKKKVLADDPLFALAAVDLLEMDTPTFHIARFLPSLKCGLSSPSCPCHSAALPPVLFSLMSNAGLLPVWPLSSSVFAAELETLALYFGLMCKLLSIGPNVLTAHDACRKSKAPFTFIVNIMVPSAQPFSLIMSWAADAEQADMAGPSLHRHAPSPSFVTPCVDPFLSLESSHLYSTVLACKCGEPWWLLCSAVEEGLEGMYRDCRIVSL